MNYDYSPMKTQRTLECLTPETLLSTEEVASLLSIAPSVVRRWRLSGELKTTPINLCQSAFRWGEVVSWLSKQV
ncbi:MAG: helix-turn-helix transcriptional regulator [Oligoflexus sp.]